MRRVRLTPPPAAERLSPLLTFIFILCTHPTRATSRPPPSHSTYCSPWAPNKYAQHGARSQSHNQRQIQCGCWLILLTAFLLPCLDASGLVCAGGGAARGECGACACQSQYLANGLHILNIGKGRGGQGEQGSKQAGSWVWELMRRTDKTNVSCACEIFKLNYSTHTQTRIHAHS